jgi:hypothetical protein
LSYGKNPTIRFCPVIYSGKGDIHPTPPRRNNKGWRRILAGSISRAIYYEKERINTFIKGSEDVKSRVWESASGIIKSTS